MAKRHTYIIEVKFVNFRDECAIGTQTSGYLMSNGRTDTFDFKRNGFTITAERSTIYVDGTILSSDRNGLYGQVLKGLLVYYALSNDYPKVKSISIVRKRKIRIRILHIVKRVHSASHLHLLYRNPLYSQMLILMCFLKRQKKGQLLELQ